MEVLQTSALPLGYVATLLRARIIYQIGPGVSTGARLHKSASAGIMQYLVECRSACGADDTGAQPPPSAGLSGRTAFTHERQHFPAQPAGPHYNPVDDRQRPAGLAAAARHSRAHGAQGRYSVGRRRVLPFTARPDPGFHPRARAVG